MERKDPRNADRPAILPSCPVLLSCHISRPAATFFPLALASVFSHFRVAVRRSRFVYKGTPGFQRLCRNKIRVIPSPLRLIVGMKITFGNETVRIKSKETSSSDAMRHDTGTARYEQARVPGKYKASQSTKFGSSNEDHSFRPRQTDFILFSILKGSTYKFRRFRDSRRNSQGVFKYLVIMIR